MCEGFWLVGSEFSQLQWISIFRQVDLAYLLDYMDFVVLFLGGPISQTRLSLEVKIAP